MDLGLLGRNMLGPQFHSGQGTIWTATPGRVCCVLGCETHPKLQDAWFSRKNKGSRGENAMSNIQIMTALQALETSFYFKNGVLL